MGPGNPRRVAGAGPRGIAPVVTAWGHCSASRTARSTEAEGKDRGGFRWSSKIGARASQKEKRRRPRLGLLSLLRVASLPARRLLGSLDRARRGVALLPPLAES